MCCIFTWMAWCFDASHRVVVFIMACVISSSVCCLLLIASLAGVAMGYNYSLAEYIDLKETNISVYIKRGVYDDEIADDFDWRRAGGGEPSISLKDNNGLRMGPEVQEGQQPLAAGRRRAENSIFESDEQNKYEGGLMRLTSTQAGQTARRFEPPEPPYTTPTSSTANLVDGLLQVADSLPGGSKERLRVIQAAARHHEARKVELATAKIPEDPSVRVKAIGTNAQIHSARRADLSTTTDKYAKYFGNLAQHPGFPGSGLSARKYMDAREKDMETVPPNRFRDAVFRGDLSGWPLAGAPKSSTENFFEYDSVTFTMPTAPTVNSMLVRPVEGKRPIIMWDEPERRNTIDSPVKLSKPEYKEFGKDVPRSKILNDLPKQGKMYDDYEDSRGLPVRKKRSDGNISIKTLDSEPSAVSLLTTRITSYQNHHNANALDADLEISTNYENRLGNDVIQSENSTTIELTQPSLESNSSDTAKVMLLGSNYNISNVAVEKSNASSLEQLSSSVKNKDVNSDDNKYEKRGIKKVKSIWRRISDFIKEQWNRLMLHLRTRIYPILYPSWNSKSDNSDWNSSDNNKTTFINKLVAMSTKKLECNGTEVENNTQSILGPEPDQITSKSYYENKLMSLL